MRRRERGSLLAPAYVQCLEGHQRQEADRGARGERSCGVGLVVRGGRGCRRQSRRHCRRARDAKSPDATYRGRRRRGIWPRRRQSTCCSASWRQAARSLSGWCCTRPWYACASPRVAASVANVHPFSCPSIERPLKRIVPRLYQWCDLSGLGSSLRLRCVRAG